MKRNAKEIEQAQEIVSEYLQETNNNPHEAYNKYIKYYLESGKSLPTFIEGIKDFIRWSKPEQNKSKIHRPTKQKESIKMNAEDILEHIKQSITLYENCIKECKSKEDKRSYWTSLQAYKIMYCKIIGIEYICIDYPA
jgi:hypothetical protein